MNVNVGPLAFQWAHILALACALLAIGVGRLVGRNSRVGISDVMFDMALVAVPTGRVVFVALWFAAYQDDPWSIFDIRDGGLELWSASVAAASMAVWRIRQRPALKRPLVAGLSAGLAAWSIVLFTGFNGAPPGKGVPALTLAGLRWYASASGIGGEWAGYGGQHVGDMVPAVPARDACAGPRPENPSGH